MSASGPDSRETYREVFERRGAEYDLACKSSPSARDAERRALIGLLELRGGERVCDVPAGGGYVAEALDGRARVVCLEPVAAFVRSVDGRFAPVRSDPERMSLRGSAVDRVSSLAAIHHLGSPAGFFREAARILRDGGIVAVADVLAGSAPARFLDDVVDRFSETGHRGRYLRRGELHSLLESAGFEDAGEWHRETPWIFPDREAMAEFCRSLFGLRAISSSRLLRELERGIGVRSVDGRVHLEWSLLFGRGRKPRRPGR